MRNLTYLLLLMAVVLICVQIWADVSMQSITQATMQAAGALRKPDVDLQKARQDLIAAQIANESRGFLGTFAGQLSALVATLVTVSGAILALRSYLDDRAKERRDRLDAREKERQDRLAASLSETLSRLVGTEARQRVVGAAGLLPFLEEDKSDYHLQALTALLAAARVTDEEPVVRQAVRLGIERACRTVRGEITRRVSWQGIILSDADLAKQDLRGICLRSADLQNANLREAKLDESDLGEAKLQGAHLERASLHKANLAYCDLAGADLSGAILTSAQLVGVKVLKANVKDANFTESSDWRGVPWDVTLNWRQAKFDAEVRKQLDTTYGPEAPDIRVLMLMWEIPPLVAGGTWTASYHLVRNLRRRGADVTVVVPWERELIGDLPFGTDVQVVGMGIRLPNESLASPYGYSPYGSSSPYYQSWSPYARTYSPYAPNTGDGLAGSTLFRLMGEFSRRLRSYILDHPAGLIHAHDWVTFEAAYAAAQAGSIPWISHFHSTEEERQLGIADRLTQRIERGAVTLAARIIAPSQITSTRIIESYDAALGKVAVVPNTLSEGPSPTGDMGRFETRRVVFIGRLTPQKGVDLFCKLAEEVRRRIPDALFEAFGEGEQRNLVAQSGVRPMGRIDWDERGRAFRGASVVVVPSRAEPFGMVILEAMQHRVPVIYPSNSGAAEVLKSGIKVDVEDLQTMAARTEMLLQNLEMWEDTVQSEAREIDGYPQLRYEDRVIDAWRAACSLPVA